MIVLAGFVGAGFLIGNSYHEWLESPILTTITTHPLDDLDFPAVTVCPPQGSNTALNFDLMQMNNSKGSFSEQQQKKLRDVIRESLVEKPHQDFAKRMLAATQKANLRKTFKGHFSVTKPYGKSGEELRLWDTNGTIESENFKGNFSESSYKTDRDVHVVLELPDDFYPTDMHWIPRGGGGAPGRQPSNRHQVNFDKLGKKAAGGSDLFLLTSATGRLQLVGCTMHISILSLSKAHHYCVPKYT